MTLVSRITLVVLPLVATGASAQTPQRPTEPTTPARFQVGPLSVRPSILLRDVGYDSNIRNEAADEEGDVTATFGARVDVGLEANRVQASYSTLLEYLYFQSFESERGWNSGAEGRVDFLFTRLQPFVTAGLHRSHERPNAEIDERADRVQSTYAVGALFAALSRTTLFGMYRHTGVDYADDELFRGVALADELNGGGDAISAGADIELSPLTTLSLHGERAQDRFDVAVDRDANSYRVGATATFNPLALISGRASVGVRAFRPLSSQVPDFTGLTAAVAVSYAFRDRTRIGLTVDRDLRYSFADLTPYYVSTGGRVTVTQRLVGNVDAQVVGGAERLAYEARLDAADTPSDRDSIRTVGAGLGYRLNDEARVGINFDYATRSSPADDREYSRGRVYGSMTYGF